MIEKILRALGGLIIMPFCVRQFRLHDLFEGKRVAIIGAADSALEQQNGDYINAFDFVIRINKSLTSWNMDNEKYIGTKSNILFHSFYENTDRGGGGELDLDVFAKRSVKYLIQPRNNSEGKRVIFNFFKKYLKIKTVFTLPKKEYENLELIFGNLKPTMGFSALYSALVCDCEEIFITGFTFFKTPYAEGYRDHLLSMEANKEHIESQGQHDPELEYQQFKKLLVNTKAKKVIVDHKLMDILKMDGIDESPVLSLRN